jgi:putative protein kinase ArgK-like GTPase of G3E family
MDKSIIHQALSGDKKSIARCISWIENKSTGYEAVIEATTQNEAAPLILAPAKAHWWMLWYQYMWLKEKK